MLILEESLILYPTEALGGSMVFMLLSVLFFPKERRAEQRQNENRR